MSPYYYSGSYAFGFGVYQTGALVIHYVSTSSGVRPVINLKSSTTFLSGNYDGSDSKPWIVEI